MPPTALTLAVCLLVLSGCVRTSGTAEPSTPQAQPSVTEQRLDREDFVGAAVAVLVPGEREVVVAVGSSEPGESGTPIDPNEPLNVGSVTKTFVAVVALQLMQEGKLQLDQKLDHWFPAVPQAGRIRLRDLLRHTSGLNEYLDSDEVQGDAQRRWMADELIRVAVQRGAIDEPGDNWHYANTNYILLGEIIGKVTGRPWYEAVRDRISQPLGMQHTAYAGEPSATAMGKGYRKQDGDFVEATDIWHASVGGAAGAMISTASDLMRFIVALRQGRLLDEAWLEEMRRFVAADDIGHVKHAYGLGYERYILNEVTLEGHMGTGGAYVAFMGFDPRSGIALTVLINVSDPGLSGFVAGEVLAALTDKDIGPPPQPSVSVAMEYVAPSQLAEPERGPPGFEVQVSSFETRVSIPTSYSSGVVSNGLDYQQLRLDYTNPAPGAQLVEAAHALSYNLSWFQRLDESWSMLTLASPGLASDFRGELSVDDLALEVALVGIYAFSDRFAVGLGAGYNARLGMQFPMPVMAVRWQPTPTMKLEAILPQSATFAFQPHPILGVGIEAMLDGGSYHGDPDWYEPENPQMRYSLAKVGSRLTFHLMPWVHLQLASGYAFLRRFEFYDGTDELVSYDLDNNGYMRAGLSLGGG